LNHRSDVAIVGSGPYALSLASQLRARGVDFRIFGPPMKFWHDMPRTINLKSFAFATNIYVPAKGNTLPDWCRSHGKRHHEPCPMSTFAAYGMAMQSRFVPSLEPVQVVRVSIADGGFELTLESEERLFARRVVFATGLTGFSNVPGVLRSLPSDLLSHTFDLGDREYDRLRGKDVIVVGGGASAIEAGALVHEVGGRAQILVREAEAIFHETIGEGHRSLYERLRWPASAIGFGLKSRVLEMVPMGLHFVPEGPRVRFDRVRLRLRSEGEADRTVEADHVIAGTGYVADVDRLTYLDAGLRRQVRRVERAPKLSINFESTVKNAYFLGPVAAMSFGPLFRFVAGADYAAPALARHLAGPMRAVSSVLRRFGRPGEAPAEDEAAAPSASRTV
jgi:cation diffusion facilitator CzcD-associated flavoprotein CzcO